MIIYFTTYQGREKQPNLLIHMARLTYGKNAYKLVESHVVWYRTDGFNDAA